MPEMRERVVREIEELHAFFETWFLAKAADPSPSDLGRVDAVLDPTFTIVSPSGLETSRSELMDGLRDARGSHSRFRLWVEDCTVVCNDTNLVVARYHECQELETRSTRRVSTAVLRESSDTPNGLVWVRVHETWKE